MSAPLLGAIILGVVAAGGLVVWLYFPSHQRRSRFEHRSALSLDQIYAEYFACKNLPKELACELWREVSACLKLPPEQLRPSDRFDLELAATKGWEHDDELLDVQWAAERRLKAVGSRDSISQIKTVGDYVEFFCNLQAKSSLDCKST